MEELDRIRMECLERDVSDMEERDISRKCLVNNERAADSPGPRLQYSEIWALNMNPKVDELIDIQM